MKIHVRGSLWNGVTNCIWNKKRMHLIQIQSRGIGLQAHSKTINEILYCFYSIWLPRFKDALFTHFQRWLLCAATTRSSSCVLLSPLELYYVNVFFDVTLCSFWKSRWVTVILTYSLWHQTYTPCLQINLFIVVSSDGWYFLTEFFGFSTLFLNHLLSLFYNC
jgi:hypothetical protein